MTLTEFTAAVNALSRAKVEKLNAKFRAGLLLFGVVGGVFFADEVTGFLVDDVDAGRDYCLNPDYTPLMTKDAPKTGSDTAP